MSSPQAATATQLRNIEQSTGRTLAQWAAAITDAGLVKHGEIVAHLKAEHGLTHGNANALALHVRKPAGDSDDLLAAQYAGAKAALRPLCDQLIATAREFGPDVEVTIQKTGVSLRRAKQFALIQAKSAQRIEVGLNLKGTAPTERLAEAGGMCTHSVRVTEAGQIDKELRGWLKAAYTLAAPKS
jgi:hypothetical protein